MRGSRGSEPDVESEQAGRESGSGVSDGDRGGVPRGASQDGRGLPSSPSLRTLISAAPVLIGLTAAATAIGYLVKMPCKRSGFDAAVNYSRGCYTDIYPLFFGRGLVDGKVPYLDQAEEPVEYPVLTGWFMQAMSWLAHRVGGLATDDAAAMVARGMAFYDLTVVALALCAVVAVLATAYAAGRFTLKAGLMVAAGPGLLLAAYINWDLLAVALSALALAAWARRWTLTAGLLLGLAVAAKFYPVVFLGPWFLLCLRAGRLRAFGRMFAAAAGAWLVVNGPVMLAAWDGWVRFYTFSQERGVDWGSIFYLFTQTGVPVLGDDAWLNKLGTVLFLLLCVGIAVLALAAPRRPRLPQLLFLVLAAFMITNKVWSPQYVLWLLPVIALARPKFPAYWLWQFSEIGYYFGIWWYLFWLSRESDPAFGQELSFSGIDTNQYYIALLGRFLTVTLMAVLVVIEILRPGRDAVRADADGGDDDPAGGVLDGAPDRVTLRRLLPRRTPAPALP